MECTLCFARLERFLFPVHEPQTQEAFSIYFCDRCQLGQTTPLPKNLAAYYPPAYYAKRHRFTGNFCVRRRMGWIKRVLGEKKGKLLDLGCGKGDFLKIAVEEGWQVAGTELNPEPARAAGFEVQPDLNELKALGPFDCITLWHSLEHFPSPPLVLQQASALLKPQGLLFIAVPNAQGWQARLFAARWLHCDVPRHLYHFGPTALRCLLQTAGFAPFFWRHQEFEYDLLGWSQSALNCLFATPNVFFEQLRGRPSTVGPLLGFLNYLGGVFFSVLALPLLPLAAAFQAGGTVVVAARKPLE